MSLPEPYYDEDGITIYHGDCREILPHLQYASIDLVVTDPPYGVDYDGGTVVRELLQGDDSADLYRPALWMLRKRCKSHAALYLFYADSQSIAVRTCLADAGWQVRTTLIWKKNMAQFGALTAQYKMQHEPLLYCHLAGESPQWFGATNETSVWDHDRSAVNEFHPTQKPVDLIARAILNSSKPNDLVCDPFMGSGTTLRAAKDLGRQAIGIEVNAQYCAIAVERLQQEVLPICD